MPPTEERTPKYGLTDSTRKPARIAANELSRAINALKLHHDAEPQGIASAEQAARAALPGVPEQQATEIANRIDALVTDARDLRTGRGELLVPLLEMRDTVVDLLLEEHATHDPEAILSAHVEPGGSEEAPTPIDPDGLAALDALRILAAAVGWTQRVSYAAALQALGPTYLLAYVIEYSTPQASGLRSASKAAHERLGRFLAAPWRYRPTWELG